MPIQHPSFGALDDDRIIIFDTTLRDGEQSPGASMNLGQKLQVAKALRDLGVDVIEAGFAAASPGDHEAIRAVGRQVEGPIIASLARCAKGDIEAAYTPSPTRRASASTSSSPRARSTATTSSRWRRRRSSAARSTA